MKREISESGSDSSDFTSNSSAEFRSDGKSRKCTFTLIGEEEQLGTVLPAWKGYPGYEIYKAAKKQEFWRSGDYSQKFLQAAQLGNPQAMSYAAEEVSLSLELRKQYYETAIRAGMNRSISSYVFFLIEHYPIEAELYLIRGKNNSLLRYEVSRFMAHCCSRDKNNHSLVLNHLKLAVRHKLWDDFSFYLSFYQADDEPLAYLLLQVPTSVIKSPYLLIKRQQHEILRLNFWNQPSYFQQKQINRDIWGVICVYL